MVALTVVDTTNPIKVTGTTTARELITDMPAIIRFIRWYNPTAPGDLLELKDINGEDIIILRCEKANQTMVEPIFLNTNGIISDNMDSGTLYIYLR